MTPDQLESLALSLLEHPNVVEKLKIASAYSPALGTAQKIAIGDDTAAIPDSDGFLLFAAEGMIEGFIELDPWFAGYSAVMVNLSDIAAMGGSPTALVDVVWTEEGSPVTAELWAGMQAASAAYGVPIVGGHTTRFGKGRTPLLAVAVVGRAKKLITSFDAKPGDTLLMAVDLRGAYRGEGTVFWNASVGSPPERLQADLKLLPQLAEAGLLTAGKDLSNGGLLGTLAMLLATSAAGAVVQLDQLPQPPDVDLSRWLLSFPSYGYLLTAATEHVDEVCRVFAGSGIACAPVGSITDSKLLELAWQDQKVTFAEIESSPSIAAVAL
ncbi:sll0787 family AIR synthase-like protein [Verrucomicrobium sp. BvORR106]|uniref:sll0787 family AIR synthase-like protein n=1 Tax=Verrucomicrobium sp. BvORR106 TaxID=1403819 RepID=UPI000571C7B3|nr:sll0787 family AIR synthase-like protein [Verrucomicrobium sp. BvORR106]